MTKPLRLGVAGLGVVGSGLTRLLWRQGNAIAERAGRPLALQGYSARRSRDGGRSSAARASTTTRRSWPPKPTSTCSSN